MFYSFIVVYNLLFFYFVYWRRWWTGNRIEKRMKPIHGVVLLAHTNSLIFPFLSSAHSTVIYLARNSIIWQHVEFCVLGFHAWVTAHQFAIKIFDLANLCHWTRANLAHLFVFISWVWQRQIFRPFMSIRPRIRKSFPPNQKPIHHKGSLVFYYIPLFSTKSNPSLFCFSDPIKDVPNVLFLDNDEQLVFLYFTFELFIFIL